MAQQNLISVQIPESDLSEIRSAISTLHNKLMPHLKTLNNTERQELPKMGDKTTAFVMKALEYGQLHKELVPVYLDMEAMKVDVGAVQILRELSNGLTPLADALNDSAMLSGSEAYQGALVFYNNVKGAAKVKVANAQHIYDDLANRFPGAPAKKPVAAQAQA